MSSESNCGASLDDYRWLTGGEGRQWLEEVAHAPGDLLKQAERLRRTLSAERVHLLLEQIELRRRARQKFAAAERMFFTPTGLEQATDQWVAAYKAGRFPPTARTADLCCGIGGDLLALAARADVLAVDRNEVAALFAQANLAAIGPPSADRSGSEVLCRDIAAAPLDDVAAWHIDPDRRPQGRRTTRVELHEPGLPAIERLLAACPAGAVKLAPAAVPPERWARDAEWEWISRGGQCRQLVAWFGPLARSVGLRRASVLKANAASGPRNAERNEVAVRSILGRPGAEIAVAARLGRFLAEPDAAVLAANLTGALAAERHLAAISPGAVYLTGDDASPDPALAWFEIADALPFDLKRLKALLRERQCGRLEIKQRGAPHDPEQVRRQLRVPGENSATVFITRLQDVVTAIVARRLAGPASTDVEETAGRPS